jgi:RNA polymerase sigma factor (sigma-70 family)
MTPEQDEFIESLFHEHFNQLKIYAISYLKNSSRADEIVQDTFHEAVTHIEVLMAHENPKLWLKRTAKNKIRNSERVRNRYLRRYISLDAEQIEVTAPQTVESEVEQRERQDDSVSQKVGQVLTKEELYLLKRIALDKATHMEVAEELSISVWASQKRLERIRTKLEEVYPERKRKK